MFDLINYRYNKRIMDEYTGISKIADSNDLYALMVKKKGHFRILPGNIDV